MDKLLKIIQENTKILSEDIDYKNGGFFKKISVFEKKEDAEAMLFLTSEELQKKTKKEQKEYEELENKKAIIIRENAILDQINRAVKTYE